WREANAVHEAVELGPGLRKIGEQLLDLRVVTHIAIEDELGIEVGREFGDAVFETLTHVAERKLGTLLMAGPGDAIGDRAVGQNARDQQFLASEKTHFSVSREKSFRIVACV